MGREWAAMRREDFDREEPLSLFDPPPAPRPRPRPDAVRTGDLLDALGDEEVDQ